MEGSVHHQTPVFAQLDGVVPDVQQVLRKNCHVHAMLALHN